MNTETPVVVEARRWLGTPYHHQGMTLGVGVNTRTYRLKTEQTDLAATATGTTAAIGGLLPRLLLKRA